MVKLNIGCGNDYKNGWINIDIDPDVNPDIVHDVREKLPYKENTIDEILLQDVVEHLTKQQAEKLLTDCFNVQKINSKITVRVPDVKQIVKQFGDDEEVMLEFLYGNTDMNDEWGAHKQGYTTTSLSKTLKRIGYSNITIEQETTNLIARAQKIIKPVIIPNIAIIVQSPDWGGAEEWLVNLINHWTEYEDCKISIYTNSNDIKYNLVKRKIKINHLPFILDISGNWKGLIKTILLLPISFIWYANILLLEKRRGMNCIVASNFSEKLLVTWLSSILRVSTVWFEYGPMDVVFKRNFYIPKIAYLITRNIPKRIITISRNTRNNLINSAKISSAKLKLIYPGVCLPKNTYEKNSLVVGCMSRLTPEKGQRILIEAWKYVAKEMPDARLVLAGRGPDSFTLKRLVENYGLESKIKFVGFVKNKSDFYNRLSLFVFPTIWEMEGFGIVQIEALSYSVPVIAFNRAPSSEIITQEVGVLIDEQSPEALSKAIIELLKNHQLRDKMSKNAKTHVIKNYNLPSQAKKVYTVLDEVIRETA